MIIGIGIDVVSISRIEAAIRRRGQRFVRRVFCPKEVDSCSVKVDPMPCYAARFAAKEAFVKAIGTGFSGGITFRQICVEKIDTGAPVLVVSGTALQKAQEMGAKTFFLSISHERDVAVAMVVIEG